MLSKKFLSVMTAVFLLAGVGGSSAARSINPTVSESSSMLGQVQLQEPNFELGGPTDLNIANEDKIIQMLQREGKISKDATYEQQQKVYLQYMQSAAKNNQNLYLSNSKLDRDLMAQQNQKVNLYQFNTSKRDTNPKKVNILVLLVDYSDYKHSSIQPGETDMYYKDYSHQHYQDMLFGDNGYVGPNGKNLISMKQYYNQQSGGSLDVEGTVAGWYTLPQTAKYYGEHVGGTNDLRPRTAVFDALKAAAMDPNINLANFDKEDPYDYDKDGDLNEPDGIIDYLMVLHAGVGEEAGGGSLGSNAIWSHSWTINSNGPVAIPGVKSTISRWGGALAAYRYTIEPEDGATGVFAHEFGHNLGLPDEYDTQYTSSAGEPISFWSIMSSGSWGGTIPGTEPTGFSPYAKQMYQALYGGNWQKQITLDYNSLSTTGALITLRQADEEGQAVRINLPDKAHVITTPTSGKYAYWGGKGKDGTPLLSNMTTNVDLTNVKTAQLNFKTWYDIEDGWDYASVQVREVGSEKWTYLPGNLTTTTGDPQRDVIVPYGITGSSGTWKDASFDLSSYSGKKIELKLEYQTDSYSFGDGIYVDDIKVIADSKGILVDNAEGTSTFTFNGFSKNTGSVYSSHYYLVEWRNYHGVDTSLAHIGVLGQNLSYDPGMVVWYVDNYYTDNWTGVHPGNGYLGIVDADQHSVLWKYTDPTKAPMLASGRYQMHDAAFSQKAEAAISINTNAALGRSPVDNYRVAEPIFNDSNNYLNAEIPPLGRNIPKYGLKIQILNQANDNSCAILKIQSTTNSGIIAK